MFEQIYLQEKLREYESEGVEALRRRAVLGDGAAKGIVGRLTRSARRLLNMDRELTIHRQGGELYPPFGP